MLDQNLATRTTGPDGSAETEYSASLDTGGAAAGLGKGPLTGKMRFLLRLSANANLSDAKIITFTLQHSADNSSFADIAAPTLSKVQTGAGGVGTAASDNYFDPPPNLKRYVRVKAVTDTSPGTLGVWTYDFFAVLGNQAGL
jgi:hypothetical protein